MLLFRGVMLALIVTALLSCGDKSRTHSSKLDDKTEIFGVMKLQENDWNRGDIRSFMNGYWQSDSLLFVGSRGLTYGWEETLANYLKSYPDKETMGQLTFDIFRLESLSDRSFSMVGKYTLVRSEDQPSGFFTLIWKKVNGHWVIVQDMTN